MIIEHMIITVVFAVVCGVVLGMCVVAWINPSSDIRRRIATLEREMAYLYEERGE